MVILTHASRSHGPWIRSGLSVHRIRRWHPAANRLCGSCDGSTISRSTSPASTPSLRPGPMGLPHQCCVCGMGLAHYHHLQLPTVRACFGCDHRLHELELYHRWCNDSLPWSILDIRRTLQIYQGVQYHSRICWAQLTGWRSLSG